MQNRFLCARNTYLKTLLILAGLFIATSHQVQAIGDNATSDALLNLQNTVGTEQRCCFCTKPGAVGVNSTFCSSLSPVTTCENFRDSGDFASLADSERSALSTYNCIQRYADCALKTGPTDNAHVCPNAPYSGLVEAASVISPSPELSSTPGDDAPERPFSSITPNLSVSIPGLTFTPASVENGYIEVPFLAQYISAIQRYLIGLAGLAAVIMIVYGGFLYLLGSSIGEVGQGKAIVTDAIIGLCITLGAYFILYTVNPNLTALNALRLPYIEEIELPVDSALGELGNASGFQDTGPIMCVAFNQCPDLHLVTVKQVLEELRQTDAPAASSALLKIFGCTGIELNPGDAGRNPCKNQLNQKLNPELKTSFLNLLSRWPATGGHLKLGEIHRQTQTQFYGYMPLRAACGPLLSGFPAPRSACPRGGHGTGSAMDIWFVPNGQAATNNCADVVPGKPFPQFLTEAGWVHLCHEDWHFEPTSAHPNPRTTNTWRNIPCFGGADDADSYISSCPAAPPTPTPASS